MPHSPIASGESQLPPFDPTVPNPMTVRAPDDVAHDGKQREARGNVRV